MPHLTDGPRYPALPTGKMAWRTVASRANHRLELHDGPAVRGLRLSTGNNGQSVRLDQTARTTTVASTGLVTIRAGGPVGPSPAEITVSNAGTTIRGPVRIEGPVTILGELGVTGATTVTGAANVTGVVGIEGDLNVTGAVETEGAVNVLGGLLVEGGGVVDGIPIV